MSNPPRYQFVFRHLSPIQEISEEGTLKKPFRLQRNESQGLIQHQTSWNGQQGSMSKCVSTPNLQMWSENGKGVLTEMGSLEDLMSGNKNNADECPRQVNANCQKLQNMHQQSTTLNKTSMTSNQKKPYQYYFKKTNHEPRDSWPRFSADLKSQPYIKYQKYSKLNSSIHNSSATKDTPLQRVNASLNLLKNDSQQNHHFVTTKNLIQRDSSIENKTQKNPYNFVTPSMSPVTPKELLAKESIHTDRVMETVNNEVSVNFRIQQSMAQSQMISYQLNESKHHKHTDSTQKSKQFEEFFNQTMGQGKLGVKNQKINTQKIQNLNTIKNLSQVSYLEEIQKIKTKLKSTQIQEQTLVKIQEDPQLIKNQQSKEKNYQSNQIILCLECQRTKKDLTKTKTQFEEIQKKRQANLDQIFRQQKTIKEMQENEAKLKTDLQNKQTEIRTLTNKISAIALSESTTKEELSLLQKSFNQKIEAEISQIKSNHQGQLEHYAQKISTYVSTISKQNKRIQEMEENFRKIQRETVLEHEGKIEKLNETGKNQIQAAAKETEKKYLLKIEDLQKQHEILIARLNSQNVKYTSSLVTKIQQLEKSLTIINDLKETIEKLESEILLQKSARYDSEKQLGGYKLYAQQLKGDIVRVKQEKKTFEALKLNELEFFVEEKTKEIEEAQKQVLELRNQNMKLELEAKQLEKQKNYLKFMNKVFKVNYIEENEYQAISKKLSALISENKPSDEIIKIILEENQVSVLIPQSEKVSISPSTQSLPKSQKALTKSQIDSLLHELKSKSQQVIQLEVKQFKLQKQLFEKEDHLMIKDKMIKSLQENVKAGQALTLKLSGQNIELKKQILTLETQILNFKTEISQNEASKAEEEYEKRLNEIILEMDGLKEVICEKDHLIDELNQKISQFSNPIQKDQNNENNQTQKQDFPTKISPKKPLEIEQPQSPPLSPPQSPPFSPRSCTESLMQQLESKDYQIQELSTQLQESFDIIKMLKRQLEERQNQFILYQEDQKREEIEKLKITQEINGDGSSSANRSRERSQKNHQTQEQMMAKDYLHKIQEYYNEVLEIFGLDEVSFGLIHETNAEEIKLPSPRPKMPLRSDSLNSNDSGPQEHQQSSSENYLPDSKENEGILPPSYPSSFESLPNHLSSPTPFENLLSFMSSTQEEVLRIINQWIRKLERQSLQIHECKQKIHMLERQKKNLDQANSMLEMEKLHICDKYENFISKIELQNSVLEQKTEGMVQKVTEMETYVKQLQEVIIETNKQSLKNGLYALELTKNHNVGDIKPIHYNPYELTVKEKEKLCKQSDLLLEKDKSAVHHTCLQYLNRKLMQEVSEVKEAKSYWEDFYEKHAKISVLNEEETEAEVETQKVGNQNFEETETEKVFVQINQ